MKSVLAERLRPNTNKHGLALLLHPCHLCMLQVHSEDTGSNGSLVRSKTALCTTAMDLPCSVINSY